MVDIYLQRLGTKLFPWIKFPHILGSDIAGEVVEVGSSVTRFKPGDRVVAMAAGLKEGSIHGAFQTYSVAGEVVTSHLPASISYAQAAVLPLAIGTAACGLFQKDYLALQHPTVPPKPTGETVLIWGGATSVGCAAIQLAVAAGYEVISTSSPKNFDYVRGLGASAVFDYASPTVTADIIAAFAGKKSAGALAIGSFDPAVNVGVVQACVDVVVKSEGRKFVAMAVQFDPAQVPEGVGAKFIFGSDLKDNEVGPAIFEHFLPKALEEGAFKCGTTPLVAGEGLESIQEAFEVSKKGVSAQKVVVTL
jgi:NADPH:quinone reductase-like Zn-dependent oxidoreductase